MTVTLTLTDLLPISEDATDWDVAACRGDQHPDRWFPDPSESFDYAARICARCPIANACGTYASATGQTGVWGGREYRRGKLIR
ncbi:WhiB family transcriptional regulator [Rhodococcus sp. PD04]|uniref:WhiB family transcriptional regulator n=1 Tax=Rhodococcus sp. PD04 TaxID=3109594 RepID=UPI002DDC2CF9|nr:WhiB family transcriptional regulator [Rhodococcus sp. PD04]WSE25853.1 WhiB family transcriptional regulator [Rhodococcus sp. PD04]